jgi:hypothetical protein
MTSSTDQPREDPFHLYSISPHLPQFQQSAGATPLWSRQYSGQPEIGFQLEKKVGNRKWYHQEETGVPPPYPEAVLAMEIVGK